MIVKYFPPPFFLSLSLLLLDREISSSRFRKLEFPLPTWPWRLLHCFSLLCYILMVLSFKSYISLIKPVHQFLFFFPGLFHIMAVFRNYLQKLFWGQNHIKGLLSPLQIPWNTWDFLSKYWGKKSQCTCSLEHHCHLVSGPIALSSEITSSYMYISMKCQLLLLKCKILGVDHICPLYPM